MIERLLGFGADANVKSAQGVTPIGQYRSTISGRLPSLAFLGCVVAMNWQSGDRFIGIWKGY